MAKSVFMYIREKFTGWRRMILLIFSASMLLTMINFLAEDFRGIKNVVSYFPYDAHKVCLSRHNKAQRNTIIMWV